jgi:hypothetical protein
MDRSLGRDQSNPTETSQKEVRPAGAKNWHMRFSPQLGTDSHQASDARQKAWNHAEGNTSRNLANLIAESNRKILTGFGNLKDHDSGVSEALASDKNKATDLSRERRLQTILDNARPVLPDGVKEHLDTIIKYHEEGSQNKPSDAEYIEAYKQALQKWCPEIWKKYENVNKFATDGEWDYAKLKLKDGKCTFYLPPKTTYPIDILLRGVDETLTMKYDAILEKFKKRDDQQNFDADFEMRVKITARVLEMNMELGDMGWKVTKEYPLAYQHQKDYEDGIRRAFENGSINENTPKNEVRQIGYEYACKQLYERNKPKKDGPEIFLNTMPGSYFREWDKFTKMQRRVELKEPLQLAKNELDKLKKDGPIQIGEDNQTLSMKGPIKLGSAECNILLKFLDARAKEGGKEGGTLKVGILPNKEIWVLPYYFSEGEKTTHSIAARGNPVVWAGEVDIAIDSDGNAKVTQLKGDSGHYLTYNSDPEKQKAIFQLAESTFRKYGYDTSGLVDVSKMGLIHQKIQVTNEIQHESLRE